jgi:hypothetical protein
MVLSYFAEVTQNTGEDWVDVAMSLSTSNPAVGSAPPPLRSKTVDWERVNYYSSSSEIRGRHSYDSDSSYNREERSSMLLLDDERAPEPKVGIANCPTLHICILIYSYP